MTWLGWAVIVAALGSTIWLIFYVGNYLPQKLDERFRDSLRAFRTAIELRFPEHKGVSKRTIELSRLTGHRLGLPRETVRDLMTAALVKDLGLCAIPHRLLNGHSPHQWTDSERETFEKYPEVSVSMLMSSPSLKRLAPIVRQLQIDFNKENAPETDRFKEIRVESRVLRVTSDYAWFEKLHGQVKAREAIVHGIGSYYDPVVVRAFLPVLTSARDVEITQV